MSVAISVSQLKSNLMVANEAKDFPHPQNLLENSSDGLKYLFENVFLDLLIEKKKKTVKLDFDAFELQDIYDLYDFCNDNCTHMNCKEMKSLWKIYSDCRDRMPSLKKIAFV